jgi:hypothetical protein
VGRERISAISAISAARIDDDKEAFLPIYLQNSTRASISGNIPFSAAEIAEIAEIPSELDGKPTRTR